MAGLYLHIPFCKRVCAYCDFYKSRPDLRPHGGASRRPCTDELCHGAARISSPAEPSRTRSISAAEPRRCRPPEDRRRSCIAHAAELFDCSTAREECHPRGQPRRPDARLPAAAGAGARRRPPLDRRTVVRRRGCLRPDEPPPHGRRRRAKAVRRRSEPGSATSPST